MFTKLLRFLYVSTSGLYVRRLLLCLFGKLSRPCVYLMITLVWRIFYNLPNHYLLLTLQLNSFKRFVGKLIDVQFKSNYRIGSLCGKISACYWCTNLRYWEESGENHWYKWWRSLSTASLLQESVLKYSTADRLQNRDVSTCCYLVGCYYIAIYQLPIPQGMLKYGTVTNCFKPAYIYYVNTFLWKMDGI